MNKAIVLDYNDYLSCKERSGLIKKLESNFKKIVNELGLMDDYQPITYYLYPTEKIKIQEMGEDGNAEADIQKKIIHMVYNKDIRPTGPHELVHILTSTIGSPNYVFSEGLAEYFEDYWKAEIDGKMKRLPHDEWVRKFVKEGTYVSIDILFDDSQFWKVDESAMYSYPESGSFVKYLVERFGLEKVIKAFKLLKRRPTRRRFNHEIFYDVFGRSVADVERDWLIYLD